MPVRSAYSLIHGFVLTELFQLELCLLIDSVLYSLQLIVVNGLQGISCLTGKVVFSLIQACFCDELLEATLHPKLSISNFGDHDSSARLGSRLQIFGLVEAAVLNQEYFSLSLVFTLPSSVLISFMSNSVENLLIL